MDIGAPELLIILAIVILVFGVGRIGKLGGELGGALREFRKGLGADDKAAAAGEQAKLADTSAAAAASPAPAAAPSAAAEQPKG